jgi:hypothetical protein
MKERAGLFEYPVSYKSELPRPDRDASENLRMRTALIFMRVD